MAPRLKAFFLLSHSEVCVTFSLCRNQSPSFLLVLLRGASTKEKCQPTPAPLGVPRLWFSPSPERALRYRPHPTLSRPRGRTCRGQAEGRGAQAGLQGALSWVWNERQ